MLDIRNVKINSDRSIEPRKIDIGMKSENGVTKIVFEFDDVISQDEGILYLLVNDEDKTYVYPLLDNAVFIGSEITQKKKYTANIVISKNDIGDKINNEDIIWISKTLTLVVLQNNINVDSLSTEVMPQHFQIIYDDLFELRRDLNEKLESGYFKGDKGDKGDSGEQGPKGDKGDPGEKGADGRDGVDGRDGIDGKDGEQGPKGEPGDKGDPGQDGVDGYTPIKGEDYYTEEEKLELIQTIKDGIIIPTKLSQLENDKGFVTNTVNDLVNYHLKSEVYTKEEVQTLIGRISSLELIKVDALPTEDIKTSAIYLVPSEQSEADNIYTEYIYMDDKWEIIGDTNVDLSQYALKTEIPTKLSQLTNDAQYSQFSGSYNDLSDKPTVVGDVQINGSSMVVDGVANIPKATSSNLGLVGINEYWGITIHSNGNLRINGATSTDINNRNSFMPITPSVMEYAVMEALSNTKADIWTEERMAAARTRMGAVSSEDVATMINDALGVIENGTY